MEKPKVLLVKRGGQHSAPTKIKYFPGTSVEELEHTARAVLQIPASAALVFCDASGDVVALSSKIPDNYVVTVKADDRNNDPAQSSISPQAFNVYALPKLPALASNKIPVIGSLLKLQQGSNMDKSFCEVARQAGTPCVFVKALKATICLVRDVSFANDILTRTDDFDKIIEPAENVGAFEALRRDTVAGEGLFTSSTPDKVWQKAHRILFPAFGLRAVKGYYNQILSCTNELLQEIETKGSQGLEVTAWMTRLTVDVIGISAFGYRFNSCKTGETHSFVRDMVDMLIQAQNPAQHSAVLSKMYRVSVQARKERMAAFVQNIIDQRRQMLEKKQELPNDLLTCMLTATDKETGGKLDDKNIIENAATFLIAGHETTSGLLSYVLYELSQHPEALKKVIAEADAVLGRDYNRPAQWVDLDKLEYINCVIKETLRLHPPAPAFVRTSLKDTHVAGKYFVPKDLHFVLLLSLLHRDKEAWGPDAEQFRPERWMNGFDPKPASYLPFGHGLRNCIGFQFALSEAKLVVALLYQRFAISMKDPTYKLDDVQTLTLKPKPFEMIFEKRPSEPGKGPASQSNDSQASSRKVPGAPNAHGSSNGNSGAPTKPILFLYGSNMGSCEDMTRQLASKVAHYGYAGPVMDLDAVVEEGFPQDGTPVIIVTSTYNGNPPDNATRLAMMLKTAEDEAQLAGVEFTVLGIGHTDWKPTFQHFPIFVEKNLLRLGAKGFLERGVCNVARDMEKSFEEWSLKLCESLVTRAGGDSSDLAKQDVYKQAIQVNMLDTPATAISSVTSKSAPTQSFQAQIFSNTELQGQGSDRSTRHIEVAIPPSMGYLAGDHLGVFPENPPSLVEALCAKLGCDQKKICEVVAVNQGHSTPITRLPMNQPVMVGTLLSQFVDLCGPPTIRQLRILSQRAQCPPDAQQLKKWAEDAEAFATDITGKMWSIADVLLHFPSLKLDLGFLLDITGPIKPRYYSISSSSAKDPRQCSITVGVVKATSKAGGSFSGLCSNYLAGLPAGSTIQAIIRDTKSAFRAPATEIPLIMIGPGTGIAPMRGFIQERDAALLHGFQAVGVTELFFGCRRKDQDYIYRTELEDYSSRGVLTHLSAAFSRSADQPKKYVQDLIMESGERLWGHLQNGAYIMVCGDAARMAPDVTKTFVSIASKYGNLAPDAAEKYIHDLKRVHFRYLEDVWASGMPSL